ncbi:MAG TPA: hypothetical protein ENK02_12485 [Planctomycetes bacterium]|nr:hypothetical protein [Planctomycetota bacterium]
MITAFYLTLALLLLWNLQRSWGPGIHLDLALRVINGKGRKLPKNTRETIEKHKEDFFYGNIAADIIHFKSYGGARGACHQWEVLKKLDKVSKSSSQKAFILGYGCHLAADTVSHNHFVPYHLCRFPRYGGFGHLYWELSADQDSAPEVWDWIQKLQGINQLAAHDHLIAQAVPKRVFSMAVNKRLFNHFVLAGGKERWRKGMRLVRNGNKGQLEPSRLDRFRREALQRVIFFLQKGPIPPLSHIDPSGKVNIKKAIQLRKELRRTVKALEKTTYEDIAHLAKIRAKQFLPS